VTSAPGEGATFTLRFRPASPAAARPAAARLRILLIDDEGGVREALGSLLRTVGHTVLEADGGAAGLVLLAGCAPELVITDLGMPGMTGWEVAQRIKAAAPRTPVILLTGWGQQVTGSLLGQGAVDRVLGKPILLDELQTAIAELLGGPEGGEG